MTNLMTEFNKLINNDEYWENGVLLDGEIRDTLADMFPMMDDADLEYDLNVMIETFNAEIAKIKDMMGFKT